MKIGSLVELINDKWKNQPYDEVFPVKNKVYTVRAIEQESDGIGLLLEEIVNPPSQYIDAYGEPTFRIERFRELQPPIVNIEEYINQNTLEYEERV